MAWAYCLRVIFAKHSRAHAHEALVFGDCSPAPMMKDELNTSRRPACQVPRVESIEGAGGHISYMAPLTLATAQESVSELRRYLHWQHAISSLGRHEYRRQCQPSPGFELGMRRARALPPDGPPRHAAAALVPPTRTNVTSAHYHGFPDFHCRQHFRDYLSICLLGWRHAFMHFFKC